MTLFLFCYRHRFDLEHEVFATDFSFSALTANLSVAVKLDIL